MGPNFLRRTLKQISFLSFGLLMGAAPAYAVRDWNVTEETDLLLSSPVCRAWTNVARSEGLTVELSTSFPKAAEKFPVIYVKVIGLETPSAQALVRISSRESQPLFLLREATAEGEADIYWYAPTDQDKVLDIIKRSNNLDITFSPESAAPQKVSFSLRGSSATLDETLECVNTEDFQDEEFLEFLNTETALLALPATATPQELFDQVQLSYQDYVLEQNLKVQIETNEKDIVRLKRSETQARTAFTTADTALANLETELVDKQTKLATSKTSIPLLQQKVVSTADVKAQAQLVYDKQKAIFDPIKARVAPFEEEVADYQKQVEDIQGLISNAQSEIAELEKNLSNWEDETSDLESVISRKQGQIEPLRRQKRQLENQIATYNVDRALDDILDNDGNYRRLRQERASLESMIPSTQDMVRQAQRQLRQARRAFDECRGVPSTPENEEMAPPFEVQITTDGPAGPFIDLIGEIIFGDGGFDLGPADGPCATQRQNVQEARRQLRAAQTELQQLEQDINDVLARMNNIEEDAREQAEQGRNTLVRQLDKVTDELDEVQDDIADAQNRIRTIGNSASNARSEIRSLRTASLDYERQLTSARRSLASAKSDLAQKKTETGYDRVFVTFDAARKALSLADREADKAEDAYSDELKLAEQYRVRIQALDGLILTSTTDRNLKETALTQATQAVVQAEDLKVSLETSLAAATLALEDSRRVYQELYEKLMEEPVVAPL